MDAQTLKLECLKLAADKPAPEADIVKSVEIYWQWLTSSSGHSPSQREDTLRKS